MAAILKDKPEASSRKPKKDCMHLSVTRTHEGDRINRLECNSCGYVFFMDHVLFDRVKSVLRITSE